MKTKRVLDESKELYGTIYRVRNNINGKVYIGQTKVGFRTRYRMRKTTPLNYGYYMYQKMYYELEDRHCNKHVYHSMEKYGYENFSVDECIDFVYKHKYSQQELDFREQYWIEVYDATNPEKGYNKDEGGRGGSRINENCLKVVCLNNKQEFLSLALAGEFANVTYDNIAKCCRGDTNYSGRMPNGDYAVWAFYDDFINLTDKEINKRIKDATKSKRNRPIRSEVRCITNGMTFKSIRKCAKYFNVNHGRISECCKGEKEFIIVDGKEYKFEYIGEITKQKVICITTKRIFDSCGEAEKFYNIGEGNVSVACNKKNSTSGKLPDGTKLEWRYLKWNHNKKYKVIGKIKDSYNPNYVNKRAFGVKKVVRPIICLTTKTPFKSVKDACECYNIKSHIKVKQNYCGKLPDGTPLVWRYIKINHNKILRGKDIEKLHKNNN